MQIVECAGTPRKRGQAHGEQLRKMIADGLRRWAEATIRKGASDQEIDEYCDKFMGRTSLVSRAKQATPDLYSELVGIAEGSGQPLPRLAAYNLMDEQWWYASFFKMQPPGCSLIAMPIEGGCALAQNMDLPDYMNGSQVALRLSGPDIPESIVLSAAGLIGLTGANAAGLAVGVNTLLMLNHSADGLPVAFAVRHALAARDRQAARHALDLAPHASGQHYALVGQDGITSIECSATACADVAIPDHDALLHTNHPLASDDLNPKTDASFEKAGINSGSRARLDWLQKRRQKMHRAEDIKQEFDDPKTPMCMRPETHDGSSTFATVIYEMTDSPRIRMRKGVAGTGGWVSIPFHQTATARAS